MCIFCFYIRIRITLLNGGIDDQPFTFHLYSELSEQNNAKIFKTPYIYVTICWCEFQKRDVNRFLTSVEEDDVYTPLFVGQV